jgi:thiol-disulfide isomerase/thioredoxin
MAGMLALAAGASFSLAKDVTLRVGDSAPKLSDGRWVQGEPVKDFVKGNAYIVEFWATWCGPCKVSIPHLNEIYTKFKDKDLVVIGQDCWERDDKLVEPFVKDMGEKMTYRVVMDDKSQEKKGVMAITWMDAAGRNGIPSAFLVNKQGKIAWIGHPMELKDSFIEEVLADKQDLAKATADYEEKRQKEDHKTELTRQLSQGIAKKEWAQAESALKELESITPKEQRINLDLNRIRILMGKGDSAGASKLANELSDAGLQNLTLQSSLGSAFGARPDATAQELELASKFAARANDIAKGKNAFILTSLAQYSFKQGNKAKAVEYQEQAIALAEGKYKETLEKTLATYKSGESAKLQQ